MKFTALRSGQFIVSVDGVDVSKHTTEREALESAVNRVKPGNDVRYRHDYVVVVQASTATLVPLTGLQVSLNPED